MKHFEKPTNYPPAFPPESIKLQRTRERCHYKISAVSILQLGIFVISATVRCVSRWQEAEFDLEVAELFDAGRNQSEEGWRRGAGGDSSCFHARHELLAGCQAHQLLLLRHVGDRALCADLIRRCFLCDTDIECDATPPSKDPPPGLFHFLYSILVKLYFPPLLCGEVSQQTHFATWGYNGEASGASGMHRCLNLKTWPRKTGINFLTNWGHQIDLNLTSEAWTKCQSKFQVKESQILQDLS